MRVGDYFFLTRGEKQCQMEIPFQAPWWPHRQGAPHRGLAHLHF